MITTTWRRRTVTIALTLALGAAGCSSQPSDLAAAGPTLLPAAEDCQWMQPAPTPAQTAVTVVIDPTGDVTRRLLPADAVAVLREASLSAGTVSVVSVDGTDTPPATPLLNVMLSDPSAGPARAQRIADLSTGCVQRTVAAAHATTPGSDLLSAWQTAARHTPVGGHILMVGSGVPTAGTWNLTTVPAGQIPPSQVIAALPATELPDLSGRSVILYGLGDTQVPMSQTARTWLTDLNLTLCTASRATTCEVSNQTGPPMPDSADHNKPQDPTVDWPQIRATTLTSGGQRYDIPSALLFDIDRADLAPAATDVLRQLATTASTATTITITGHTDSDCPTPQYCQTLSTKRAIAVANYLTSNGVPATHISTRGAGDTQPATNDRNPNGTLNPTNAATNRRVTITIT